MLRSGEYVLHGDREQGQRGSATSLFSASSRLLDLNGETNRVRKKESSAIIPRRR
jgi:hypothetical protein